MNHGTNVPKGSINILQDMALASCLGEAEALQEEDTECKCLNRQGQRRGL